MTLDYILCKKKLTYSIYTGSAEEVDGEDQVKLSKTQLQAFSFRLNTLENLVKEQNTEIQKLQQDLKNVSNIREVFTKELDTAMSANCMQLAKMFDNYMNLQQNRDRELRESFENGMSGVVVKQLLEKIQSAVVTEIKHTVTPNLLGSFDTLKHQLEMQYSQKLNTIDNIVKENISKFINNKVVYIVLKIPIINVFFLFSPCLMRLVHQL